MAKICIEIEIEDDGSVMVGVCPPEQENAGEEAKDKQYLQPAKSVDDALSTAKDLLSNPQAQEAAAQPQNANDQWNRVQRDRAMANQPGGPMMGMK